VRERAGLIRTLGGESEKVTKFIFWDDCCADEVSLKEAYPRIYANSTQKNSKLEEIGVWIGQVCKWQLCWRRTRSKWEK